MPRQRVTHYTDLEEIGHGAMGTVYKARDLKLGRVVALKFLSAKLLNSPDAQARFRREAQALSALSHLHTGTPPLRPPLPNYQTNPTSQ